MPVNIDQYRGAIEAFNRCLYGKNIYINSFIRMLDVLPIASAFLSILLTFILFLLFSKSFCFTILLILLLRIFSIYALATYVFHIKLYLILTKQSGEIEQNPGPKSNSCQSFSPVSQTMMTIWKFLVMIYFEQTTYITLNKAVFVFIIETLFP